MFSIQRSVPVVATRSMSSSPCDKITGVQCSVITSSMNMRKSSERKLPNSDREGGMLPWQRRGAARGHPLHVKCNVTSKEHSKCKFEREWYPDEDVSAGAPERTRHSPILLPPFVPYTTPDQLGGRCALPGTLGLGMMPKSAGGTPPTRTKTFRRGRRNGHGTRPFSCRHLSRTPPPRRARCATRKRTLRRQSRATIAPGNARGPLPRIWRGWRRRFRDVRCLRRA